MNPIIRWCIGFSLLIAGAGAFVACGSSSSPPATPTPVTPAPAQNKSPVVGTVTVTPTFGIADLQRFSFVATASDPDGDALSYSWDVAGNSATGSTASFVFVSPGGNGNGTLTVSDGKGGSATANVTFIVGSLSGSWRVDTGLLVDSSFQLSQTSAGLVTGTFVLPSIGTGNTDPAQPGQVLVDGSMTMRVKIGAFTDFTMIGSMDTTGRRITGRLEGSGFSGQPFSMVK